MKLLPQVYSTFIRLKDEINNINVINQKKEIYSKKNKEYQLDVNKFKNTLHGVTIEKTKLLEHKRILESHFQEKTSLGTHKNTEMMKDVKANYDKLKEEINILESQELVLLNNGIKNLMKKEKNVYSE